MYFTAAVPQIRLWFDITNNCRVDLEMDRLLVEAWVFAPMIYGLDNGIFDRIKLGKKSTVKDINYFQDLSREQAEQIGEHASFDQGRNRWEVRARVQVTGWFYSWRTGWFSTGKRNVFHHDALPVEGVPPKRVVAPAIDDQRKEEAQKVIRDSLQIISSALTRVASGSLGNDELPVLTGQIADNISKLRVACYPLYHWLDKIAGYLTTLEPRDAGWVSENLITPLVIAAQQYLND